MEPEKAMQLRLGDVVEVLLDGADKLDKCLVLYTDPKEYHNIGMVRVINMSQKFKQKVNQDVSFFILPSQIVKRVGCATVSFCS